MGKVKVGDKMTLEARVRRVDDDTFTIRIGDLTPITLPHGHPAVLSVAGDKVAPKRPRKPAGEEDLQIAGVRSDGIEFVRCNLT